MIDSLNAAQTAMIDVYVEKYTKIGFDTTNIPEEEIKEIINEFYTVALGNPVPEKIVIKGSPKACWDYICEVIGQQITYVHPFLSGHTDVNIFAFYDYMINELNVPVDAEVLKKYNVWRKIMKVGNIYPFDDECIVSLKPIEYHKKGTELHNESGPAIKYPDGFEIYIVNGVRMKKEYVMTPWNKLDCHLIVTEKNAEVRRELVRKIGIERIIKELGGKVIDTKGDYELLTLDLGDNRTRPYLKMKNPSIGVYHIEGVSPECKTVKEALKFRNGTSEVPEQLS